MSTPFLGEIKIVAFQFAPKGWVFCHGQPMPITQYQALYSLLGYRYGGGGANFNLPDLRDRIVTHPGPTMAEGKPGGDNYHTLKLNEMATHRHRVVASDTQAPPNGNGPTPTSRLAGSQPGNLYGTVNNLNPMNPAFLEAAGGGQPHTNRQPFTPLNYVMALTGEMPPRDH